RSWADGDAAARCQQVILERDFGAWACDRDDAVIGRQRHISVEHVAGDVVIAGRERHHSRVDQPGAKTQDRVLSGDEAAVKIGHWSAGRPSHTFVAHRLDWILVRLVGGAIKLDFGLCIDGAEYLNDPVIHKRCDGRAIVGRWTARRWSSI